MQAEADSVTISLDEVRELALGALTVSGADHDNAEAVADVVVQAERDGCASHGLFRIPGYCASLKSGRINGNAVPRVDTARPGIVRIDGDNGFAPLAVKRGRPFLIEKARRSGIAALTICQSAHFAALWPDTEPIADAGLVAVSFVNSRSTVAPAGGKKPVFGTNPMSFAIPRGDGKPPMVFDQASSVMARGEIMIAAREGKAIPEGVGLDRQGRPTTDPAAVLDGVQLAFGGYKGASIAMMVEILAAGLSGGEFSFEAADNYTADNGPSKAGHLIIALDPQLFHDQFSDRVELLFRTMLAENGTRLPGDRRLQYRQRTPIECVSIPRPLYEEIMAIVSRG